MKRLLKSLIICAGLVLILPNLRADSDLNADMDAKAAINPRNDDRDSRIPAYFNEIAAIVDDDVITMERVRMDIAPLIGQIEAQSRNEQEFRENLFNAELDAINSTINRKLIVRSFLAKGGKISDTYEKKEYESYLQRVFGGNRLEFAKHLKEYGKSVREFKSDVKERAIINFMLSELRDAQPEVSPAKIKEYYDSHLSEFFKPREVELKQIVVFNENGVETPPKLAAVKQALLNGEDFESVAKQYSDSFINYNIGYVYPEELIPEVATAIKGLPIGGYSLPITLSGASYIFFLSGEHPANQQTLQEASPAIRDRLTYQYQEEARIKWLQNLRKSAYIKIFLTR